MNIQKFILTGVNMKVMVLYLYCVWYHPTSIEQVNQILEGAVIHEVNELANHVCQSLQIAFETEKNLEKLW